CVGELPGGPGEVLGRLAVPQAVLDAVEAGEVLVLDAFRQSVGAAVDLLVEVLEGAVGGAERGVGAVGGEPVGAGLVQVVAVDGVGEGPGLADQGGQTLVDVRLVRLQGGGEVLFGDGDDRLGRAAAADRDRLGGDGLAAGGDTAPGVGAAGDGGDEVAGG